MVRDVPHLTPFTMQLLLRHLLCIVLTDERVNVPSILLMQVFVVQQFSPQTLEPLLSHCKVFRQTDLFFSFKQYLPS